MESENNDKKTLGTHDVGHKKLECQTWVSE